MKSKKENARDAPKDSKMIKVSENGPYLVSGGVPILKQAIVCDSEGTAVAWRVDVKYSQLEKCRLCRCGQSKNKPFCDGTHTKVGFVGTETAGNEPYLDSPKVFRGATVTLIDAEVLCASARFCHRAGGIWNIIQNPETPGTRKTIIEEACDCPSGRLVVRDELAGKVVEPDLEKSIVVIEDPWVGVSGPLWVRGCIPVESASGEKYNVRNRVTLCRCGKSQNKPFCDSSHYPEKHEEG